MHCVIGFGVRREFYKYEGKFFFSSSLSSGHTSIKYYLLLGFHYIRLVLLHYLLNLLNYVM